jgi:hypothetical protein
MLIQRKTTKNTMEEKEAITDSSFLKRKPSQAKKS